MKKLLIIASILLIAVSCFAAGPPKGRETPNPQDVNGGVIYSENGKYGLEAYTDFRTRISAQPVSLYLVDWATADPDDDTLTLAAMTLEERKLALGIYEITLEKSITNNETITLFNDSADTANKITVKLTVDTDPTTFSYVESGNEIQNAEIIFLNASTNNVIMQDNSGVTDLKGEWIGTTDDSITLKYDTTHFIEQARTSNFDKKSGSNLGGTGIVTGAELLISTATDITLTESQMNSIVHTTGVVDITLPP